MTNILLIILLTAASAFAQVRDTELKVERRTLDRQDKLNKPRQNAEELTRGLKITVKNPGTKSAAAGEVEWAILVQRPGMQKNLLSTGKETLKVLKARAQALEVYMPLVAGLHAILFEGRTLAQVIELLMRGEPKTDVDFISINDF